MTSQSAFVTVTYNSSKALQRHWANRPVDVPWIVVDNASTDDSVGVARSLGATVVPLPRNVGFSAANNIGAALSDASCLIFLNPDVTADSDTEILAKFALENRAVVAPQLMNSDLTAQENGRSAPYAYRKVLHFVGHAASKKNYEVTAARAEIKNISWAIGAAIAVPKDIFNEIGGWDDHFFIYYEDSDFCIRAREADHPVLLLGSVRWVHGWARETRRGFSLAAWRLEIQSALRFYARYPGLLLTRQIRHLSLKPAYQDALGEYSCSRRAKEGSKPNELDAQHNNFGGNEPTESSG